MFRWKRMDSSWIFTSNPIHRTESLPQRESVCDWRRQRCRNFCILLREWRVGDVARYECSLGTVCSDWNRWKDLCSWGRRKRSCWYHNRLLGWQNVEKRLGTTTQSWLRLEEPYYCYTHQRIPLSNWRPVENCVLCEWSVDGRWSSRASQQSWVCKVCGDKRVPLCHWWK